jgi:hypothetical protein
MGVVCGILYIVKRGTQNPTEKNFSKSFEKPLDKSHIVWYNVSVERGRKQLPMTERKCTYE